MHEDTIDEVYDSYYADGATDGLPVIPPSEHRVQRMLEGTDLAPDHELARLGDREGILTVEKLAANGVMAGCLPIHMPVLIAGVKAISDPRSAVIEASVGTDSSAHLFLLNGPIRRDLDVNIGTGAFGPGFRSNATIGRALGLAIQNTIQVYPGEQAMGVLGNPFKYNLLVGEYEEKSPWDPFHVEYGFEPEESTIAISNTNCFIQTYPPESDVEGVLSDIVYNTPPQIGFRSGALFAISPFTAAELSFFSKRELKEYLYDNMIVDKHEFIQAHVSTYNVEGDEREQAEDPVPPVKQRIFNDPDEIEIYVTGGEGKWNGIVGPMEGGPVIEKIELPDNWESLREEYAGSLERTWGKRFE